MKNYNDLTIYNDALNLFYQIHELSLKLPHFELYEQGSQIRRSSASISTNIVEGYGRKMYKADFIKFLNYSYASGLETIHHIKKIRTLYPQFKKEYDALYLSYDKLNAQIFSFIKYVKANWKV